MKALSTLVLLTMALCGLVPLSGRASGAAPVNITGTWELTIHYPPPDGDYPARYELKQDGEKITGTYQGMYGPADVTGTIRSNDVVLSVTVQVRDSPQTARFTGTVASPTKMSGTVTGTSDQPRKWTAEKKN